MEGKPLNLKQLEETFYSIYQMAMLGRTARHEPEARQIALLMVLQDAGVTAIDAPPAVVERTNRHRIIQTARKV